VAVAGPDAADPTAATDDQAAAVPVSPRSRRGERWRATWLVTPHASLYGLGDWTVGLGVGGYAGVGVPVRGSPRLRQEHGFGFDYQITAVLFGGFHHRFRLAGTGLVGRELALYYQGSAGYGGFNLVQGGPRGPSVGGRLGFATGDRVDLIFAIGGDVDFLVARDTSLGATAVLSLFLLTLGAL
jgi:hypothetical protein